jgi:2-polyprenyl-3-methyl-5-hydroxy-6-metoxy-1,4-benzoquinol methylase
LLSEEGLKKLEKSDRTLLQKAKFNDQCLFKQKRVLDIGCNVGAMAT